MDVLTFRKYHTQFCIQELLPIVIQDIATRLDTKVESLKLEKPRSVENLRGFNYDNITAANIKFKGFNPIRILIPISDENDQFTIVDSKRILTLELLDDLFSVRQPSTRTISIRLQFIKALQSNNQGMFENLGVSLYKLYTLYFTPDELYNMQILIGTEAKDGWFQVPTTTPPIYTQVPYAQQTLFQKTLVQSYITEAKKKKVIEKAKLLKTLDSYLDPISKFLNNITSFKDVLQLLYDDLMKQKDVDLVGTNLHYKRVRNEELIIKNIYMKLLDLVRYQKQQSDIRFVPDFVLRQFFIDPSLQKLFEYINLINPYQELSLKYKLVLLIEHLSFDLRDVHSSFLYRIDPIDGPDDSNIGKRLQLAFDCELDELGRFL